MTQKDKLIGTVKGPGELPHEYLFITKDNKKTRIGEFVYYQAEDLQIIGTIKSRKLVRNLPDAFLSDPNTPPNLVSSLIGLQETTELYEISVETIGYFDKVLKDFVNPRIPPMTGDGIFLASSETLSEMLSPKKHGELGSAHIGSLLTRKKDEVPVILSIKEVVSTHLAILASTGSGKSYTAGVLIEEMMRDYNGAAILIIDPHSEYDTLASIQGDSKFRGQNGYIPEVKIFQPDTIKVRFSTLTEGDLKYLLPEGTSDKMLNNLSIAFRSMTSGRRQENWTYADLEDEIEKMRQASMDKGDNANVASLDGLSWRLDNRFGERNRIFTANEHIKLNDLYKPGRCTVLQLSDIEQNEQQVIVASLLRRVNKARMDMERKKTDVLPENRIDYPVFTLLEESHRFAPAGASVVSTNILKQILSEGRKFGVGIGLITQRPGKLDQDVLSQCMTQIIMRIVNPIDQETIAKSVEGTGRAMLAELPALTKGQAIISGVGVNTPVMCRIRERLTKHGGETIDAPGKWAQWHSPENKERREMDNAPYFKQSSDKPPEKIGGIKI